VAGFPNFCPIAVRVANIEPKRSIVAQDTSNLPEHLDQSRDILLRCFFLTNLIIGPYRATFAARSAANFMLMRATPSSVHMRSRGRLGSLLLGQLAMIALRVPTDPSSSQVIANLKIGGTRDTSLYRSRWQSTENGEAIALEDLHAGIHRPTLFRSVFTPDVFEFSFRIDQIDKAMQAGSPLR
jgi:hypothetical protein